MSESMTTFSLSLPLAACPGDQVLCRPAMQWPTDIQTAQAATAYLPIIGDVYAAQFGENGEKCGFNPQSWDGRVVQPSTWPAAPIRCTPAQIIAQFQERRYTQALAMVACWGLMWRQPKTIWGARRIETIEQTLCDCAQCIRESQSIADPWRMLTGSGDGQLGWAAVITSKALHFLCRSLGFTHNPPAAIDGRVIRGKVWPAFRNSIPVGQRPYNWQGNTFEAYCRYMTAILTWSAQKNWTTTQMEATIFDQFK